MTVNNGTLYDYECADGLLLPIINEFTWAKEVRATLYFFGLLYCFLGISIIADIFMCSIEKIISKTRKIYMATATESEPEVLEVRCRVGRHRTDDRFLELPSAIGQWPLVMFSV